MPIWSKEKQEARKRRRQLRAKGLLSKDSLRGHNLPEARAKSNRVISIEFANPDKAAAQITEAGFPVGFDPNAFRAFCDSQGLPEPVTNGIVKRLRTRFNPVIAEIQKHSTKHFQELIDDRIGRALGYLDDFALSQASAKDLAVAIGILIEKRALLRGEPTQIMTIEERANLNVLVSAVVAEANRRGITVDQTGEEVRAIGGKTNRLLDLSPEHLAR